MYVQYFVDGRSSRRLRQYQIKYYALGIPRLALDSAVYTYYSIKDNNFVFTHAR